MLVFTAFILGIFGGFLSGFIGISSGIVVTPSLCFAGLPAMTAISSQLNNVLATDIIGFLGCFRKGAVDISLSCFLLIGGILGAWSEHIILCYLKSLDIFDLYEKNIPLLFSVLLGILCFVSLKTSNLSQSTKVIVSMRPWMNYIPVHKIFIRSRAEISVIFLLFLGWLTGILTATIGGGNGLILIPTLTYIIGRVSTSTIGTSFLAGIGITISVILFHADLAHYDPKVSFFLILGTSIGAPIGQELSSRNEKLKLAAIRSFVIFILFFIYLIKFFLGSNLALPENESFGLTYSIIGVVSSIFIAYLFEKTISSYLRKKLSEI